MPVARAEPAFYLARVAPILEQHCTQCHGETKQKGDLRLDSFAALMKGGDNGVILVTQGKSPKEAWENAVKTIDNNLEK